MQHRLLELQAEDSAVAQLMHRRRMLPEHSQIKTGSDVRARLASDLVAADTAVSDLEADVAKAESDLQPVRDRLLRNEHRIADGTVSDPKALSSLIEEVEHLKRRISDLEDAELELMDQLDKATGTREELRRQVAEIDDSLARLTASRDEQLAAIDQEIAGHRAARNELAPQIPADLTALYEKLRAAHDGVGAAELRDRR